MFIQPIVQLRYTSRDSVIVHRKYQIGVFFIVKKACLSIADLSVFFFYSCQPRTESEVTVNTVLDRKNIA